MIVDVLKQQFATILDDFGIVCWLVIGIYVAVFTVGIIIKTIDQKA
ncbi:hypothetical protein [Paralysiella testudinis]|uniref:Uncharacterized protein n=1 Tax=Paralysiella testudinis TaxID=2809020 RepID=A0A892ZQG3_9NEIS|nr:hypothetical protein [Paralysiella testudinis]QRQ83039.1 hypothetical protein JQU52_06675 [Paralysiella testudinis]